MLGDQPFQLADELGVAPVLQIEVDPAFEGREAKLLESCGLRLRKRLEGEVGKRRTPPERKRLAQRPDVVTCEQSLEPLEIQLPGLDLDLVAGRARDDSFGSERLPQLRDVVLDRVEIGRASCRERVRL